jgi:hypothetical protein
MFCPQCSQQQISPEVRFCSRCGFPLDGVAALLANGGLLPGTKGVEWEKAPPSPRLRGVRQGGMFILLGMFIVPLLLFMFEELKIVPEEVPMAAALILFLGGFLRMVAALLFEDGPLRRKRLPAVPTNVQAGAQWLPGGFGREAALPPAQSVPATSYAPPRADTSEITQRPPSVTEGTTRFLDERER